MYHGQPHFPQAVLASCAVGALGTANWMTLPDGKVQALEKTISPVVFADVNKDGLIEKVPPF